MHACISLTGRNDVRDKGRKVEGSLSYSTDSSCLIKSFIFGF